MAASSPSHKALHETFCEGQKLLSDGQPGEAVRIFQTIAASFPAASIALVTCLRHGIGTKVAPRRAWRVLERLVVAEYVPALLHAALWLRDDSSMTCVTDKSIATDDVRSVKLLRRILELEPKHVETSTALGRAMVHQRAGFLEKDCGAGVNLLIYAAENGSVEAMAYLGAWLLELRHDLERESVRGTSEERLEVARGKELLKRAAGSGDGYAHHLLGNMYTEAKLHDCLKNGATQVQTELRDHHLVRAAALGFVQDYVTLGRSQSDGSAHAGVDFDKAYASYLSAWKCGIDSAADLIGFHFEKGAEGLAKDRIDCQKALEWYERGHKKNHPVATLHLAESYDDGIGVKRDQAMAEKLLVEGLAYAANKVEDPETVSSVKYEYSLASDEMKDSLSSIYLSRSFLDADPENVYQKKLQKLVGVSKADEKKKEMAGALKALTTKNRNREKGTHGSDGAASSAMEDLIALVGDGSADELKLKYTI